jgi:hypothetical protein
VTNGLARSNGAGWPLARILRKRGRTKSMMWVDEQMAETRGTHREEQRTDVEFWLLLAFLAIAVVRVLAARH